MSRHPDPYNEIDGRMDDIEPESDELDEVDLEESAYAELEDMQGPDFEEALEAIQEDSLEPNVLAGFSDITRKQVHELRRVWTSIEDEQTRRVIADHVLSLGMDDVRLDFMRFFRVLLDDESAMVRQIAATALEPYDDPALIEPLVQLALNDPSDDVRHAAVETLGSFALLVEFGMLDRKEQQMLRKALQKMVSDNGLAPRLRASALASLAVDTEAPGLQESIRDQFESGDPDMRLGAIRAMGRAGGPWIDDLESSLRSSDPDEREAAATSISQFESENVVPMLTMLAREDREMPVRLAAISGLGTVGGEAALHALRTLREYVSDDELDSVDEAIAEVEDFIALEDGADEGFVFDGSLGDDEDDI